MVLSIRAHELLLKQSNFTNMQEQFRSLIPSSDIPDTKEEYHKEMIEKSKAAVAKKRIKGVKFILGDISLARESGIKSDLIIFDMVLHHISSPTKTFNDAASLLNEGGYLLIIDTNKKRMKADGGLWRQTIHWDSEYIVTINAKENMAFSPDNFFQISTYVLNRQSLILMSSSTTKRDFSFMGKFLMIGLVLLILAMFANIFFRIPAMSLAISGVAVLIFSGFILYDVNRIVRGGETNYIMATLSLYLDIYNLFVHLLHILMAVMGRR